MPEKISDLHNYKWGLGIEHEMHIYHSPRYNKTNNIRNFVIFDSYKALARIYKLYNQGKILLSDYEIKFLKSIPFETSGRLCNEKWVIKRVPVKMPEFVTWHPFCTLSQNRDIKNLSNETIEQRQLFYDILMKDSVTKKLVKKYGQLSSYPTGMTQHLSVPKEKNGEYSFAKDTKGNAKIRPEYNGSYHITFTLPYLENIKKNEFIDMHKNFCNQLQWLEPLMLSAYFTGDEYAPGSKDERVRGSFRVLIIGWGNFAGTDIRLLEKGIGRYAKTPTYWRKGLNLYDVDKLAPCYPPSPSAIAEGAITTLSSDIRTFGSTDPNRPEHRESGVGMTVPNGIEFRIFDHFKDVHIPNLVHLVSLVAENSRVTKTRDFVYENKYWIDAMHQIMKYGYRAELNTNYIQLLRTKLGLKIKTTSIIAYDIFVTIFEELYHKNINGKWSLIFNGLKLWKWKDEIIPEVNKEGWQLAFMLKANRNKKTLESFNILSKYINVSKKMSIKEFGETVIKTMGENWEKDIEDLAYFYETMDCIKLDKNRNGTIHSIVLKKEIPYITNFNKTICDIFQEDITIGFNQINKKKYSNE